MMMMVLDVVVIVVVRWWRWPVVVLDVVGRPMMTMVLWVVVLLWFASGDGQP